MITFYYPRWLFPNNLGDSVMTTFIPKILKVMGYNEVEVVTDQELGEVFKLNTSGPKVRLPYSSEILNYSMWKDIAFNRKVATVYPEWHPDLWKEWNSKFDYYYYHPSINLITLNYCLQMGLPTDLIEDVYYPEIYTNSVQKINGIGIVPDTKLAGRPSPHPGCDGIGFRFGGPNGKDYWHRVVKEIRMHSPGVKIYEFSRESLGLGDVHVSKLNLLDLASLVKSLKFGIMSDGGMHHVFNSQKTPVYLLGAQKVNKPYFFKLSNGIFNEKCYSGCNDTCKDNIRNLTGWPDLSKTCNGACEFPDMDLIIKDILKLL